MGLFDMFNKKKSTNGKGPMPKVADIFTAEDLQKIDEIVGAEMVVALLLKERSQEIKDIIGYKDVNEGNASKYYDLARTLMQVVYTPEKEFTKQEWDGIIHSADKIAKIEPRLAPTLKSAIKRFNAFKG